MIDGILDMRSTWRPCNCHPCLRMNAEAIDLLAEKLNKAGVSIESEFRWPNGVPSNHVRDPAGNSLECVEPKLWNS